MATPNYAFIKRQKDLAKKAKKEEKKQAKLNGDTTSGVTGDVETDAPDAEVLTPAIAPAGDELAAAATSGSN